MFYLKKKLIQILESTFRKIKLTERDIQSNPYVFGQGHNFLHFPLYTATMDFEMKP